MANETSTNKDNAGGSSPNQDPIFSNLMLYRDIATQALEISEGESAKHRPPMEDGSPGNILIFDPERKSFKHSMIAIVFSGMYIEARLWVFGCELLGIKKYTPIDKLPLERRLAPLGITDQVLHTQLKEYREARASLVHEKAVPSSLDKGPIRVAQEEAAKAVQLMHRVELALVSRIT